MTLGLRSARLRLVGGAGRGFRASVRPCSRRPDAPHREPGRPGGVVVVVVLAAIQGLRLGAIVQVLSFGGFLVGLYLGALLASVTVRLGPLPVRRGPRWPWSPCWGGRPLRSRPVGWWAASPSPGCTGGYWVRSTRCSAYVRGGGRLAAGGLAAGQHPGQQLVAQPQHGHRPIDDHPVARQRACPPRRRSSRGCRASSRPRVSRPSSPSWPRRRPARCPCPGMPQLAEAVAHAGASTVKVIGDGCGQIQEGSGFVVAPGLVVTNAHVVAGIPHPVVEDGDRLASRPPSCPSTLPSTWP